MIIRVQCGCGRVFTVAPNRAGQPFKCYLCGRELVPDPEPRDVLAANASPEHCPSVSSPEAPPGSESPEAITDKPDPAIPRPITRPIEQVSKEDVFRFVA